jgi:hypothetical protein
VPCAAKGGEPALQEAVLGRVGRQRERACMAPVEVRPFQDDPPNVLVTTQADAELDRVFRQEWGGAVATLVRLLGDNGHAEETDQEAFAVAAQKWPDAATECRSPAARCRGERSARRAGGDAGPALHVGGRTLERLPDLS